ncbi:MAG: pyridoxal 5'-phosphate synthase glutaminase subunit PdxT [Caldilineaceae bacterium SB0664_bin_22]|nr:pyridoxal 5'-phosphate synthase glutaminase subunit PdxT [Caldilineaceae bacterium SB0664_bin_22]
MRIGVLALQGAFREHIQKLEVLGAAAVEVRRADQLGKLDGLIIPGGESTTMGLVAERWGLVNPLRRWVSQGRPVWGTCAGLILLADRATGQKRDGQTLLGGLNVSVDRNFFGSQRDSFETELEVAGWDAPSPAVFIRAPAVIETGPDVEVLAEWTDPDGHAVQVAVRQGHILGTAFHPELSGDLRWHRLFLNMVEAGAAAQVNRSGP